MYNLSVEPSCAWLVPNGDILPMTPGYFGVLHLAASFGTSPWTAAGVLIWARARIIPTSGYVRTFCTYVQAMFMFMFMFIGLRLICLYSHTCLGLYLMLVILPWIAYRLAYGASLSSVAMFIVF